MCTITREVTPNTFVVAVCPVTLALGVPDADAWFLSDIYAMTYLLKGAMQKRQVWLRCCSPEDIITKGVDEATGDVVDFLAYSNPNMTRKVILSKELLEAGEIQPVRIVEPECMIDTTWR